jgi:hypothetical protein
MPQAYTRDELLALPAVVPVWPQAGRACHLGKSKTYEMVAAGTFPVPVLRFGKTYRVRTSDLLKLLGVEPSDPVCVA